MRCDLLIIAHTLRAIVIGLNQHETLNYVVNGCGMGPSHPHNPIKDFHMETRWWGSNGKISVPENGGGRR